MIHRQQMQFDSFGYCESPQDDGGGDDAMTAAAMKATRNEGDDYDDGGGDVISCHYLPVSRLGNLRACCLP